MIWKECVNAIINETLRLDDAFVLSGSSAVEPSIPAERRSLLFHVLKRKLQLATLILSLFIGSSPSSPASQIGERNQSNPFNPSNPGSGRFL